MKIVLSRTADAIDFITTILNAQDIQPSDKQLMNILYSADRRAIGEGGYSITQATYEIRDGRPCIKGYTIAEIKAVGERRRYGRFGKLSAFTASVLAGETVMSRCIYRSYLELDGLQEGDEIPLEKIVRVVAGKNADSVLAHLKECVSMDEFLSLEDE